MMSGSAQAEALGIPVPEPGAFAQAPMEGKMKRTAPEQSGPHFSLQELNCNWTTNSDGVATRRRHHLRRHL